MNLFRLHKGLTVCIFVLIQLGIFSQNKTISEKNKAEREPASKHKVMLIPFEPRMYFGEIDYFINAETQMTSREIKNKFRDGLNEQMYKALRATQFSVLDLLDDTVKYRKDINSLYQYLSYEYQKVPNQENYQPPKKEIAPQNVEKGQLNVETNSDARFMNAKLSNPKLVAMLYGKYKTDLFIFINQLDIRGSGSTDQNQSLGKKSENRKIVVHYTVYTSNLKELNSGTAETEFGVDLNQPKKIIDKHFSKIASTITARIVKQLQPGK